MNEPTTMTEDEFTELMQAIDSFHGAIFESNKTIQEGFVRHHRSITMLIYALAGLAVFDMVLFGVLAVKGVI